MQRPVRPGSPLLLECAADRLSGTRSVHRKGVAPLGAVCASLRSASPDMPLLSARQRCSSGHAVPRCVPGSQTPAARLRGPQRASTIPLLRTSFLPHRRFTTVSDRHHAPHLPVPPPPTARWPRPFCSESRHGLCAAARSRMPILRDVQRARTLPAWFSRVCCSCSTVLPHSLFS